ncbi:hypothetical protein PVAP13_5KG462400 [Panicum virgatum]|uniref:Protein ABIL1 n=1 Tax=Panicum virgatum TaxID=38727 RepID=A0A8T0SKX6_PANVG|nr:hypothetical protein PVAP13_5KG462400 [Panicum virgatum]
MTGRSKEAFLRSGRKNQDPVAVDGLRVKPPLDPPKPLAANQILPPPLGPIDWPGPNKKLAGNHQSTTTSSSCPRHHLTPRHYLPPASTPAAPAPGRHHSAPRQGKARGAERAHRVACSLLRPHVPWPLRFLLARPYLFLSPPPSEPPACRSGELAMQHEAWRPGAEPAGAGAGVGPAPTTVDEASMERSKSFVKALQELKNLRPQLYSASEYCEKSYLHSEQKQMVLDNLKDYAVRALVNAVDHLGTVAYKLTDLYEQQASEISTLELKVACLNQQVLTCQTYTDKEGLRQQKMTGAARRLHKHYIVPYAGNKRMQAFSEMQGNADFDRTPRPYSSAKTLQWHLVSEKNSKTNRPDQSEFTLGETKTTKPSSSGFGKLGKEPSASPLSKHVQSNMTSLDIVSVGVKDQLKTRPLSSFSSFDNPRGRQIQKAPLRTRSMLAAFFVKHRSAKMKNVSVR